MKRDVLWAEQHILTFAAGAHFLNFSVNLNVASPGDWPPRLRMAWEVLTKERSLPDEKALSVILESVAAAHRCVRAQNQLLRRNETVTNCSKFQKISKRISNGIRRGPAALRQQLNEQLGLLIQMPIIDLEVIEAIFEKTAAHLRSCRTMRTPPPRLGRFGSHARHLFLSSQLRSVIRPRRLWQN